MALDFDHTCGWLILDIFLFICNPKACDKLLGNSFGLLGFFYFYSLYIVNVVHKHVYIILIEKKNTDIFIELLWNNSKQFFQSSYQTILTLSVSYCRTIANTFSELIFKTCWNYENYDKSINILIFETNNGKKSKIMEIMISSSHEMKAFQGFVLYFLTFQGFSRLHIYFTGFLRFSRSAGNPVLAIR